MKYRRCRNCGGNKIISLFISGHGTRNLICENCRIKRLKGEDKSRVGRMVRAYGLDMITFRKMERKQKGVCAVCKGHSSDGKRLSIDHDHKNNVVRSLLYNRCNLLVGFIEKRGISIAREAILYLERFKTG